MSEPVYDYYATRIVQDLEDDLYESKERIQRLRRWNDTLADENERLRDGIKEQVDHLRALEMALAIQGQLGVAGPVQGIAKALTELLDGDTK